MRDEHQDGVSPIIGTVLVLGISVVGMAAAMAFGLPALQRLEDQANLESMVGQLRNVQGSIAGMSVAGTGVTRPLTVPAGSLSLQPGSSWMVTVNHDATYPLCDLQVLDWADGDAEVHVAVSSVTCRGLVANMPVVCSLANLVLEDPLPLGSCLEVYRVDGTVESHLAIVSAGLTQVMLNETLDASEDYVFRTTDRAGTVYSEAWLLRNDRLHWRSGVVSADQDLGAVVSRDRTVVYLPEAPRVDEGSTTAGPLLVIVPTLRAVLGGSVMEGRPHSVELTLDASEVRHQGISYVTRFDLHGPNAEAICNGLRLGNREDPVRYTTDALGGTGPCSTGGDQVTDPATQDDTYSLRLDPPDGAPGTEPSVVFTQMRLTASLRV